MKKGILITLLFCATIGWSQESNHVPASAINDFSSRITGEVSSSSWEASETGFKVTYSGDSSGIIFYDDEGNFRAIWTLTTFENLESHVQKYVSDNYSKKHIGKCYRLTSGTAPERSIVTIEQKDGITTLYFRPDGNFHYAE